MLSLRRRWFQLRQIGTRLPLWQNDDAMKADSNTQFSIIIPTYNRPCQLRACLQALARLDYPSERFEVIVVDDGGTDRLDTVVQEAGAGLAIRLLHRENGGPAAARNSGAAIACGKYLAFTDDDCCPRSGWLAAFERKLQEDHRCLVGGRTVNVLTENVFANTSQLIIDMACAHYNANPDRAFLLPSNNLALSAATFAAVGGFSAEFRTAEDRDLCARWSRRGYPLLVVPDAVVEHAHVLNLSSFLRQHLGYGRGAWRFLEAQRQKGPSTIEGGFYWRVLRELPERLAAQQHPVEVAALLAVWQFANLGGFLLEAVGQAMRRKVLP